MLEIGLALLAIVLAAIASSAHYASYKKILALTKAIGELLVFTTSALQDNVLSKEEAEEIITFYTHMISN